MRAVSSPTGGFQVFAVSGTNTVSFGITATARARQGLLGFGVERVDPTEKQRYPMPGFKVFRSIIPHPTEDTQVSTMDHPVQSFVWDDFTAKPGRRYTYLFHPLKGAPKNLDRRAAPVEVEVRTEPLHARAGHDVFFNRGVASSQAYARRFQNLGPQDPSLSPEERQQRLDWLTRDLDEALLDFIAQARAGDTLLCCFYEFRYLPVVKALAKLPRSVELRIIVDAKVNESTDKDGTFHESFPREVNLRTIEEAGLPEKRYLLREARAGAIAHNKFMVLLRGQGAKARPVEVWTGSTNLSLGGLAGQTNVGHRVRDGRVAEAFRRYWELLATDPGGRKGAEATEVRAANKAFRAAVEALGPSPATLAEVPPGVTPIFSPRAGKGVLDLYYDLVDGAEQVGCITLAFGIPAALKALLAGRDRTRSLVFLLLEKADRPPKDAAKPFVAVNASNGVYKAWGSFLRDPLYRWAEETSAGLLGLNAHVAFIHSKFLLRDPLGPDPVVVTGSANFSDASTTENDENMLLIRGDRRVADIYFTEFNRLFNHYYFRSVQEATRRAGDAGESPAFLSETADPWLAKYRPGSLKARRVALFSEMAVD